MTEEIAELLYRLSLLVRSEEEKRAADLGLKPVQVRILDYLERCNRYSDAPSAVAEFLNATKGTVSQSIQRLVEKGLVVSNTDAEDRRKVHLALTGEGRTFLRQWRKQSGLRRLDEELDTAQRPREFLQETLRLLQQQNNLQSFGVCHTCRHFLPHGRSHRCGLTGENLSRDDSCRLCREHELDN